MSRPRFGTFVVTFGTFKQVVFGVYGGHTGWTPIGSDSKVKGIAELVEESWSDFKCLRRMLESGAISAVFGTFVLGVFGLFFRV